MHRPVLLAETVERLGVRPDGVYVDGTLGGGGHAEAVLAQLGGRGMLFGIDRDVEALGRCQERLARFGGRFKALHGNYAQMDVLLAAEGVTAVDGVVLDFGVSSFQLDTPARGFSFMTDGPLDMRMDQGQALTAAGVVNTYPEQRLCDLFRAYGEEPSAWRIAQRIVARRLERPFERTSELAALIWEVKGGRRGRLHPATQCFQALRMEVNRELDGVEQGLQAGLQLLRTGGRMAVISFHSLEDRCVKRFFSAHEGRWVSQEAGGACWDGVLPAVERITRKAVQPGEAECLENPRARSSRLRVVERVADVGL
ncbi:MAG TPA: 16S rRNA (cytosine(1402)-N(4))-methyltransferase [Verrucomicrobia bacterium]|nr:16S rRNA (cytosine(1402)-N(4))-methyltransferase [Verrucomicrobiota bacterium]